jgi:hypothetical protein
MTLRTACDREERSSDDREFPPVETSPLASVREFSSNPEDASADRKKCAQAAVGKAANRSQQSGRRPMLVPSLEPDSRNLGLFNAQKVHPKQWRRRTMDPNDSPWNGADIFRYPSTSVQNSMASKGTGLDHIDGQGDWDLLRGRAGGRFSQTSLG